MGTAVSHLVRVWARHGPHRLALASLWAAAGLAMVGCAVGPTSHPRPTPQPSPRASPSPSARNWPQPVGQAMAVVTATTRIPLEAPLELPLAETTPNSARVVAQANSYQVELYHCLVALPVNDPAVGSGSCGSMANIYGDFGGTGYATGTAARTAVLATNIPPGSRCQERSLAYLQPGLPATVFSAPGSGPCLVTWREGDWTITLEGDLGVSAAPDAGSAWPQVAQSVVGYLDHHLLPPDVGSFVLDLAPDGLHSSLAWAAGDVVYSVGVLHGAVPAAEMAVTMMPFPTAP